MIQQSFDAFGDGLGCGGYGGLIDSNGILWSADISASALLRYNLTEQTGMCISSPASYGIGMDSSGNIWNSQWTQGTIGKFDPLGAASGPYLTGGAYSRGVAVTPDDDVWVANSGSNTVTRLSNDGDLKATINVGITPTGVAVDSDGYVASRVQLRGFGLSSCAWLTFCVVFATDLYGSPT
jgi:hypothetical protein